MFKNITLVLRPHFAEIASQNMKDRSLYPLLEILDSRSAVMNNAFDVARSHIEQICAFEPALGFKMQKILERDAKKYKRDFIISAFGKNSFDFSVEEFSYAIFVKNLESLIENPKIIKDVRVTPAAGETRTHVTMRWFNEIVPR